jgi:hypothetical protein
MDDGIAILIGYLVIGLSALFYVLTTREQRSTLWDTFAIQVCVWGSIIAVLEILQSLL